MLLSKSKRGRLRLHHVASCCTTGRPCQESRAPPDWSCTSEGQVRGPSSVGECEPVGRNKKGFWLVVWWNMAIYGYIPIIVVIIPIIVIRWWLSDGIITYIYIIISGWWCNNNIEKYEFVNGKDFPIYEMENMFQTTNQGLLRIDPPPKATN